MLNRSSTTMCFTALWAALALVGCFGAPEQDEAELPFEAHVASSGATKNCSITVADQCTWAIRSGKIKCLANASHEQVVHTIPATDSCPGDDHSSRACVIQSNNCNLVEAIATCH